MFKTGVNVELISDIRLATNKGLALGNDKFREQIEALTGQKQKEVKRGRKVGWRKNQEK